MSIFVNESHRAIYVASDGGRLCRPLIIVENGIPRFKTKHMKMLDDAEMNFLDFLRTVGIIQTGIPTILSRAIL